MLTACCQRQPGALDEQVTPPAVTDWSAWGACDQCGGRCLQCTNHLEVYYFTCGLCVMRGARSFTFPKGMWEGRRA